MGNTVTGCRAASMNYRAATERVTLMQRFHTCLTLAVAAAALVCAAPATAAPIVPGASGASYTFDAGNETYFVTADTTLNADISGNDLYVGKTSAANLTTLPGTATLTIGAGATTTRRVPSGNGLAGYGVRTFGGFNTLVTGGNIANLFGADLSVTNISGGAIELAVFNDNAAVELTNNAAAITNLFLGTAGATETPTAFISGGVLTTMTLAANSSATITGGIVPTVAGSGVYLFDTGAQANFFGTGLAATYIGLVNNYDTFDITGTLQDGTLYTVSAPLPVGVRNDTGTVNSTQRQFSLNSITVVPEAGSLALALVGGSVSGMGLVLRKRPRSAMSSASVLRTDAGKVCKNTTASDF